MILYHGTTLNIAKIITEEGFRVGVNHVWNDNESYIYFTPDFIIAASHAGAAAFVREDYPAVVVCEFVFNGKNEIVLMDMSHTIGLTTKKKTIYGATVDMLKNIKILKIMEWKP